MQYICIDLTFKTLSTIFHGLTSVCACCTKLPFFRKGNRECMSWEHIFDADIAFYQTMAHIIQTISTCRAVNMIEPCQVPHTLWPVCFRHRPFKPKTDSYWCTNLFRFTRFRKIWTTSYTKGVRVNYTMKLTNERCHLSWNLCWKKNRTLIEYLEKHSGMRIQTFKNIRSIYAALWIEQQKNLSLPSWTQSVFRPGGDWDEMTHIYNTVAVKTKQMARLRVGFLLREILERFTMKVERTLSPDRSLWVYSGHGFTITNVLSALGLLKVS